MTGYKPKVKTEPGAPVPLPLGLLIPAVVMCHSSSELAGLVLGRSVHSVKGAKRDIVDRLTEAGYSVHSGVELIKLLEQEPKVWVGTRQGGNHRIPPYVPDTQALATHVPANVQRRRELP